MKVVLDTNCFISCIGKRSAYRNVFDAFLNGEYVLCVSTEILLEYEEKFNFFWGEEVSHNLLATLLTANNTFLHDIFFNFFLITKDVDDNKFADTYLSAAADILVSNDASVLALNKLAYPPIKVMTLQEFAAYLKNIC